ncbi:MAG: type II toxin-antitoxin system RelB/DinJ family antitoxin [Oscillospiraceae bacterium]
MASTNVTIRMDEDLKKQAEDLFSDLGFNLTTALTAFVRQAVREQGIPFSITRNLPNAETLRAMDNVKNGVGLSKSFSSVGELMEDLNAND